MPGAPRSTSASRRRDRRAERHPVGAVQREPHRGRRSAAPRTAVGQPAHVLRRHADAHAGAEDVARQLRRALHRRRAAREHHARRQLARDSPTSSMSRIHELEDLVHPLVDDVRQQLARNLPVALRHGARQRGSPRDGSTIGSYAQPYALLQPLGVGLRDAEPVHDVARHVVAAVTRSCRGGGSSPRGRPRGRWCRRPSRPARRPAPSRPR